MTMDSVYPPGPTAVPGDLTRASLSHHLHAWLAMICLTSFVLLYLALAGWFTWTALRLLQAAIIGKNVLLLSLIGSASCAFLAAFMWKALFFIERRTPDDDIEITADEQPRLFEFINRLAREAGAPRPHRVFLSMRVNCSVFYDLSVLNLLFPSKKNLEIGLGLVNALTLGEFKAVLAHEFGHFAQQSMAVGRWVYIAQQIAAHIITRRDAVDRGLDRLAHIGVFTASLGWLLTAVVWSIRSIMETVFRGVDLAQRALSRDMEMQADLVAVSLTGSDALIHALHQLHVADEAWDRTLSFATTQAQSGRAVVDLFSAQDHYTTKLREIFDNPAYAELGPVPQERPGEYRIFAMSMAEPPRMWSTHPANSVREDNTKRRYIPATIDQRSAWVLFEDPTSVREHMSAHLVRSAQGLQVEALEQSLSRIDEQFDHTYFDKSYVGAYLDRALTLHARNVADLYVAAPGIDHVREMLDALYPKTLANDLRRLKVLEEEMSALTGLRDGTLTTPDGVIRYRGKRLRYAQLGRAIRKLHTELRAAQNVALEHDRRCRSIHIAAARRLGVGWDAYLQGLLAVLHYAEHSEANLFDARAVLSNALLIAGADRRVSEQEKKRVLKACGEVHFALTHVYQIDSPHLVLDPTILARLRVDGWQYGLGDFDLSEPKAENMGQWMAAADLWVSNAGSALLLLRQAALNQLLVSEGQIARALREGTTLGTAPLASKLPERYPLLPPGSERPKLRTLDPWSRFAIADGWVAMFARLAVASGIISAVFVLVEKVGGQAVG